MIYAPPHVRPVPLWRPFRGEDEAWIERLRSALAAGLDLSLDPETLRDMGAGAVLQGADPVKRQDPNGPPAEIVGRWPLADGADLLWTARRVRGLGRRVVWGLCDALVDRDGTRVAHRVRAADCRLLASYGLLRLYRGCYRHTPEGLGVRAIALGSWYEIAHK